MDGGQALEKVGRGGSAITRTWSTLSRTSAVLAAVMRFLAKRSEGMAARFHAATSRLERASRWTNAKALGVPLGADLAPEDWEEATILPLAPEPPPIPPAAFKHGPTPAEEAEWAMALEAARQAAEVTPPPVLKPADAPRKSASHPIRRTAEVDAAARKAAELELAAATPQPVRRTAEVAAASTPQPVRRTAELAVAPTPQPVRRTAELRVGPKPAAARALEPRITLKSAPVVAQVGPASSGPTVDPHVAAATKKTIAAALRT
jgi:hypothetical protein